MEYYGVIHFKSIDEKKQVMRLLEDIDLDLYLTKDLKKYVVEKYNVTIVENFAGNRTLQSLVERNSALDLVKMIRDGSTNQVLDGSRPIVHTLQSEQQLTTTDSTVSTTFNQVDQTIPVVESSHIPTLMDGADIPYLDRLVELKKETESDVEEEEGDDNISDDNVSMSDQMNVSSSSTSRRSGRRFKRPNYSMNDKRDTPLKSKKNRVQETEKLNASNKPECRKCGTVVRCQYAKKLDHIISHIDFKRFECMVDNCKYKVKAYSSIRSHMKAKHPSLPNCYKEIQLTQKQFRKEMNECFTLRKNNDINTCQLCHYKIDGSCSNPEEFRKKHALLHVDFTLYKCQESDCYFESKTKELMENHVCNVHQIGPFSDNYFKVELSKIQKLEINNTLFKCFPKSNQSGNVL